MTHRLIPNADREDNEFEALAAGKGWSRLGDAWTTADGTAVQLVHEEGTGIRHVAIKGQSEAALANQLSQDESWFYPKSTILEAAVVAETPEEAILAIHSVGITAPPSYDPEYFDIFEAYSDHPESEVRVETLVAMVFPNWPELRRLAESIRSTDPDSGVRAAADGFLTYDGSG